jgi:hypothetical protein
MALLIPNVPNGRAQENEVTFPNYCELEALLLKLCHAASARSQIGTSDVRMVRLTVHLRAPG